MSDHLLPALDTERSAVYHADLFTLCAAMPDQSVDMILADLPYGTTACSWDTVIPFEPMWAAFKRIIKPRGAIVLTANQPFTSVLVMSNVSDFKYAWTWVKSRPTGFANAKSQPLRQTEDVCVFCGGTYYPQGLKRINAVVRNSRSTGGDTTRKFRYGEQYVQEFTNYPTNVLRFDSEDNTVHPTQKPLSLFRYLIRTYTRAGELVFDPVVGSGTTALAARAEERRFVVGDSSAEYVEIARKRLAQPYTPDMFALAELAQQQGAD